MSVKVRLNNLHLAPRKVRLTAGLIKGLDVKEAAGQLKFASKRAALPLLKLLNSAVAAAKNNFALAEDNLYVDRVLVDGGQTMKRSRPRAHGRAFPIMKRTSHVTIVLEEKVKSKKSPVRRKSKVNVGDKVKKAKLVEPAGKTSTDSENKTPGKTAAGLSKMNGPRNNNRSRIDNKVSRPGLLKKVFQRKSV